MKKTKEQIYQKTCPSCGINQTYSDKRALTKAIRLNRLCISCCQVKSNLGGKHKNVLLSWYKKKEKKAAERGIRWGITPRYLQTVYERQGGRCALTGIEIHFHNTKGEGTLSIDRINSDKGYIYGNIQLVDKRVNFMKWSLSQEVFIAMCKKVAKLHK